MRLVLFSFITSLLIISCSNQQPPSIDSNMDSNEEELVEQKVDSSHTNAWDQEVLNFYHIKKYYEESPKVVPNKNCAADLNSLTYDKVIAYDFYGQHEQFPIFRNNTFDLINYNNNVSAQRTLNQSQVNYITNHFSKASTYGGTTAACFDPSMALIFFEQDTIVMEIDICLDCNYKQIISKTDIQIDVELDISYQYYDEEYGKTITLYKYGFSDSGALGIAKLAKELNMNYQDFVPAINNYDE